MRLILLALAVVLGSSASSAQDVQGRKDKVFTLSERLGDGASVRIFAAIGDVAITEASGNTLQFKGEKDGGDVEDVGYVVLRGKDGITICVVISDDDECTSNGVRRERGSSDGWRRWRDRGRVIVTVQVPRSVRLRSSSGNGRLSVSAGVSEANVSSGNGRVDVSGVQGPVTASSGNGDVSVQTTSGPVNASSGNGRIRVEMDKLTGRDDITLSTGNGRIELIAPADFSADVDASTGNGSVTTDFPIQLVGWMSPHRMRGTIGDGARKLRMSTGNGELAIRKQMSS